MTNQDILNSFNCGIEFEFFASKDMKEVAKGLGNAVGKNYHSYGNERIK